jgi:hypothetical protein
VERRGTPQHECGMSLVEKAVKRASAPRWSQVARCVDGCEGAAERP